ncbi:TetR/AcrR family transcriptional regulator C-terminal domain-containing protein [Oribacterium sp. oral taxon 102]|uniref:TetR/AcrR family transcriptional regulator n=1 Tax=Oribacterium sp. oral taxon 102 TaxID=671214 RepID=UPI0015BDA95B|nr:TetR-like C-terminal domain-containing protein [Oribacterium sp. oral taxon 102]NWO20488.1 TetR/AcrR family transcriptional regulator C-terminal domain-containing protein [Oribacterium sp. oral taxon 102]
MTKQNDSKDGGRAAVRTATTDRRIRKTTAALKHSLTELMKKKKLKDISVKELTELADVNRGTFYLHYKDVFDLMEQSEDELICLLRDAVAKYSHDNIIYNENFIPLFQEIYQICLDNVDLVRILVGENGDIKFLNNLQLLLRDRFLRDWGSLIRKRKLEHFDAYFAFIVGGCISLLQYWFRDGMQESPIELAEITGQFLDRSLPY